LKAISKAQEAKLRKEQQADEEFFRNYEPLASALGIVSSEAKRTVQENGEKFLGPGRFAKASISSRDWMQKMLRDPVTEEEQAFMDKQDEENQMGTSSEESEDGVTDDGMKDVSE
jgi:hypothetical protein